MNNNTVYSRKYDYVYSRFTLHAITSSQQKDFLRNSAHILLPDGRLYIEARTLHDDLYGKGESVGDNAFIYDGHYRRFINPEDLADTMNADGWEIISLREGKGFSRTKNSDPVLMRLIAKRRAETDN